MSTFNMAAGSGRQNSDDSRSPLPPSIGDSIRVGVSDSEGLRAELKQMQLREVEMMELLNCNKPEKLIHDLRNVLNEMQLLRLLAKLDS